MSGSAKQQAEDEEVFILWIPVRIKSPSSQAELSTSAYTNSGFRAGEPTVIIPAALARALGLDISHARASEDYVACGGARPRVLELGEIHIRLDITDREVPWMTARAICVEDEDEVLISRELMARMRIIPDYEARTWRLKDDPPDVSRGEAEPRYWTEVR